MVQHMQKFVKKTKKKPTLLERKPTQTASVINKINLNRAPVNIEDKLMRTNSNIPPRNLEMSFGESLNSSAEKLEDHARSRPTVFEGNRGNNLATEGQPSELNQG